MGWAERRKYQEERDAQDRAYIAEQQWERLGWCGRKIEKLERDKLDLLEQKRFSEEALSQRTIQIIQLFNASAKGELCVFDEDLDFSGLPLSAFPKRVQCRNLNLSGTQISGTLSYLTCSDLHLENTSITKIGKSVKASSKVTLPNGQNFKCVGKAREALSKLILSRS